MISTARRTPPEWGTRVRFTTRSSTYSPPARTSSRSTSHTCRRAPTPRVPTVSNCSTRRSDDIEGTIAVHICFGYAAIIHQRPSGYSFLGELANSRLRPGLDRDRAVRPRSRGAGAPWPTRRSSSACWICRRTRSRPPRSSASGSRRAFPYADASRLVAAPDCGMKYLSRDVAYAKARGADRGRAAGVRGRLEALGLGAGLHRQHQARRPCCVVVQRVVRDHAPGRLGLVGPRAQVRSELGMCRGRDLEPDPVSVRKPLGCVPHRDLDLIDLARLDRHGALMAVAVAESDQAVAQPLREAIRVQVDQLRGDVGVGRRGG